MITTRQTASPSQHSSSRAPSALFHRSTNPLPSTLSAPVQIQTKLTVNTPGDKYEREADRVAEQVLRMPEPQVQRQCACGKSSTEGECPECKKRKQDATGRLQRVASSQVGGIAAPPIVNSELSSPGSPLATGTRSFMESRFGQDFSHVRVHTDHQAAESAAKIHARAYTAGSNIVFGHGEHPNGDKHLLAHELTHVVQQNGSLSCAKAISSAPSDLHSESTSYRDASTAIFRKSKSQTTGDGMCGSPWTCSTPTNCEIADNAIIGPMPASTWWKLTVMIDIEAKTPADVRESTTGHTYLRFEESNGLSYTYGFYPDPKAPPNVFRTTTTGCVVHPDTSHEKCVDYKEVMELKQDEYAAALKLAQLFCAGVPNYDLQTFNCVTFASKVAEKAGRSLPVSRGTVGSGMFAMPADNPNTLIDNLRARDAQKTKPSK